MLDNLRSLQENGVVSRVGPVIRPRAVGVSTLVAMTVPVARLEEVAERVSAYPEVNHNYQRDHRFNLWFVMTAQSQAALEAVLADIARQTGLEPLSLPMVEDYFIDLGFDLTAVQWS